MGLTYTCRGCTIIRECMPLCRSVERHFYFNSKNIEPQIHYDKEVSLVAKVELKQPVVKEIAENIKDAQSVVVVNYRGLTVDQDTQLRKNLREAGVVYKVYKNTMMNFAFKGTDFESLSDNLNGPSAIAISKDDATAPARVIAEFAKGAPALEIKAGVVEGTLYSKEEMEQIAKIPAREELLSRLLGSMQSPITNFARVLNQIAEKGGEAAPAEAKTEEAAPAETAEENAPVEE
jgi:large subunit ribosomal protein L10